MKLPETVLNKESSHKTNSLNTMTLTGISLLWGVMLNLISPYWTIGVVLCLLAGYGNEISERKKNTNTLSL